LKGVIGVISGVQKGREKHSKNTFRSGFDKFEQGKDSKRFENQLKRGKTRFRKYGISEFEFLGNFCRWGFKQRGKFREFNLNKQTKPNKPIFFYDFSIIKTQIQNGKIKIIF
jgi:hypothetical protein